LIEVQLVFLNAHSAIQSQLNKNTGKSKLDAVNPDFYNKTIETDIEWWLGSICHDSLLYTYGIQPRIRPDTIGTDKMENTESHANRKSQNPSEFAAIGHDYEYDDEEDDELNDLGLNDELNDQRMEKNDLTITDITDEIYLFDRLMCLDTDRLAFVNTRFRGFIKNRMLYNRLMRTELGVLVHVRTQLNRFGSLKTNFYQIFDKVITDYLCHMDITNEHIEILINNRVETTVMQTYFVEYFRHAIKQHTDSMSRSEPDERYSRLKFMLGFRPFYRVYHGQIMSKIQLLENNLQMTFNTWLQDYSICLDRTSAGDESMCFIELIGNLFANF
jgi:hypothetical protein